MFFPALFPFFIATFDLPDLHDARHNYHAIFVVKFCFYFPAFFDQSSWMNIFNHILLISPYQKRIKELAFFWGFTFVAYKCTSYLLPLCYRVVLGPTPYYIAVSSGEIPLALGSSLYQALSSCWFPPVYSIVLRSCFASLLLSLCMVIFIYDKASRILDKLSNNQQL